MIDPVIDVSIRGALALLFATAAWHKLSDPTRFEATLRAYRIIPDRALCSAARLLPAIEVSIAIGLLFSSTRGTSVLLGLCLLAVYTAAIGINMLRGRREIDCGCFASSAKVPLSPSLLFRNAFLMGATGVAALPVGSRSLSWIDVLTIAATLLTLSFLWMATQRLAQTGPALRRAGGSS